MNNPAHEEKMSLMLDEARHFQACLEDAVDDWVSGTITCPDQIEKEWGVPFENVEAVLRDMYRDDDEDQQEYS